MTVMDKVMELRPQIALALEYSGGTHGFWDICRDLLSGKLAAFLGEESFIFAEIEHYPLAKHCHLFLAGGEMSELHNILPSVERWAKQQGCNRMTLSGRKGWWKSFLLDVGYAPKWHTMAKELR